MGDNDRHKFHTELHAFSFDSNKNPQAAKIPNVNANAGTIKNIITVIRFLPETHQFPTTAHIVRVDEIIPHRVIRRTLNIPSILSPPADEICRRVSDSLLFEYTTLNAKMADFAIFTTT